MYDIHSVVFVLSPYVKQAKQPAACGNESTENKNKSHLQRPSQHNFNTSTPLSYVLDSLLIILRDGEH